MTDPVRRDPAEFLRVLKKMANKSSWQKTMLFASRGRMIGYDLNVHHYNTVMFSQSLWGRGLEIVKVIRAMQDDNVQPNGATYYYICNGMANCDHGYNYGYNVNFKLQNLQHWRVAISALQASMANGFDVTDTMYNSTMITCTIPVMNRWTNALCVLQKLIEDERKLHPEAVKHLHNCLVRNMRPREASEVMRLAAERQVPGYENAWEPDIYRHLDARPSSQKAAAQLTAEELQAVEAEKELVYPYSGGIHKDEEGIFRPRVYRYLWYKWDAIANKYRPKETLQKRQLAPRDSPTGIPAFWRI